MRPRGVFVGTTLALMLHGCHGSVSDSDVYSRLVTAGCISPTDDGGAAAVAQEHAGPNPVWLQCLYNGGTVASCNVPSCP